jgi:hypothetical protein
MWEKSLRAIRFRWQPIIAIASGAVVLVVGLWVIFGRSPLPNQPVLPDPLASPPLEPVEPSLPTPTASPLPSPIRPPALTTEPETSADSRSDKTITPEQQGTLRISNLTQHPVRVALLAKYSVKYSNSNPAASTNLSKETYDMPAHWDFAPQEGSDRGLIVSLPNRNLRIKPGDILVAFAQDGSRHYWGPFVVGETALPVWNPKAAEWELILSP